MFEIETDNEFYCYLKIRLPEGYTIVSEPQAAYYTEWDFTYKVYRDDEFICEYSGSFKSIEVGSLVREASQLLEKLGGTVSC